MLEIVILILLLFFLNFIVNIMEYLSLLDNNIFGNSIFIIVVELERFVNLRLFVLDFCDFTVEMVRVLIDSNYVFL